MNVRNFRFFLKTFLNWKKIQFQVSNFENFVQKHPRGEAIFVTLQILLKICTRLVHKKKIIKYLRFGEQQLDGF